MSANADLMTLGVSALPIGSADTVADGSGFDYGFYVPDDDPAAVAIGSPVLITALAAFGVRVYTFDGWTVKFVTANGGITFYAVWADPELEGGFALPRTGGTGTA